MKKIYIVIAALILGLLVIFQSRSFENVNDLLARDSASNVFQEISLLKQKNEDLREEVDSLEEDLDKITNQNDALSAIEAEIEKYMKLSGRAKVNGPGIELVVKGALTTPWTIDLINQFFNDGAEAVAINGIRITNRTVGFDTLPQGQILINGSIVTPPLRFEAIGEPSALRGSLDINGGILDRLKGIFPDLKVEIANKELIQMD